MSRGRLALLLAGFDGWELFEDHYLLASEAEREALRSGPLPVVVFNSYAPFEANGEAARAVACTAVRALGARALKFNMSNDPSLSDEYDRTVAATAAELGGAARLWCECHAETLLERPERGPQPARASTRRRSM